MRFSASATTPLASLLLAANLAAAVVPATNLSNGWSYLGCYTDNVASRTLGYASYSAAAIQTGQNCITFCGTKGYPYAGTGDFPRVQFYPESSYSDQITQNTVTSAGAASNSLEA